MKNSALKILVLLGVFVQNSFASSDPFIEGIEGVPSSSTASLTDIRLDNPTPPTVLQVPGGAPLPVPVEDSNVEGKQSRPALSSSHTISITQEDKLSNAEQKADICCCLGCIGTFGFGCIGGLFAVPPIIAGVSNMSSGHAIASIVIDALFIKGQLAAFKRRGCWQIPFGLINLALYSAATAYSAYYLEDGNDYNRKVNIGLTCAAAGVGLVECIIAAVTDKPATDD